MAFIGRLHPLLIHFPIALVIAAATAEGAATVTGNGRWRTLARHNVRAGAIFALMAAMAGWGLAQSPGIETSALLEWHRWLGTIGACVSVTAALATLGPVRRPALEMWIYRIAVFAAGTLVAVSGHLGGLLVWGADFLRP